MMWSNLYKRLDILGLEHRQKTQPFRGVKFRQFMTFVCAKKLEVVKMYVWNDRIKIFWRK